MGLKIKCCSSGGTPPSSSTHHLQQNRAIHSEHSTRPQSPKFVGPAVVTGTTANTAATTTATTAISFGKNNTSSSFVKRTQAPRQTTSFSSGSGWTSTASDSTAFSGVDLPRSPADVGARDALAKAGGSTASESSDQHQQQHQKKGQGKGRRLWWGKGTKNEIRVSSTSSTSSETPSEPERKRKAYVPLNSKLGLGLASAGEAAQASSSESKSNSMYAAHSRPPGQSRMVDRFEILDTLGTGYSGKVKRAIDARTGQMVALKVMDKLSPCDPTSAKKFVRLQAEVQAMKMCGNHPHTVALHDAKFNVRYPKRNGTAVEAHVLVLELCEKGELFDLLYRGGPVPHLVCKEYFRQLMVGVSYCHGQGVAHRDLKPENLLLDATFRLKIADFGFAATNRPAMMCQSIVGTKTYMAPELLGRMGAYRNSDHGYDATLSDVWSAGVILFTMLAGHPPMEKADESDWWFRALKLGKQDLFWQSHDRTAPDFPQDAKDLVTQMLTVEPSERITVPQIMARPYLNTPSHHKTGFSPWPKGRGSSGTSDAKMNPRAALVSEMQRRYDLSMASKRLCTLASSSRGTADSAGTTSGSNSPDTPEMGGGPGVGVGREMAAHANAYAGAAFPQGYQQAVVHPPQGMYFMPPFLGTTQRSTDKGEDVVLPPEMALEQAERVTGGFMANGSPKDLVRALERALFDLGAKIDGVQRDGTREFRFSFKVLAVIPTDEKLGGGSVGLMATIFRIGGREDREESSAERSRAVGRRGRREGSAVPELVVVIKRRGGDYYRYLKVEDALVSRMTDDGGKKPNDFDSGDVFSAFAPAAIMNMTPRP